MIRLLLCVLLIAGGLVADDGRKGPKPPRPQAEIMLRLVEAGADPKTPNDAASLVPAELQKLLTFTRYQLVDSAYIRGEEDESLRIALGGTLQGVVRFDVEGGELRYNVVIYGSQAEKSDRPRLLETRTTGKSGETIVLGASRMSSGTKALIVILTGKLLP